MNDVNCGRPFYYFCERPFTTQLPDGYVYIDKFGFFKIHTDKSNFTEAEEICQSEGGHLFLLETYEEAEAIAAFIKREGRDFGKLWIGLNDTVTEGKFMTFSGNLRVLFSYFSPFNFNFSPFNFSPFNLSPFNFSPSTSLRQLLSVNSLFMNLVRNKKSLQSISFSLLIFQYFSLFIIYCSSIY